MTLSFLFFLLISCRNFYFARLRGTYSQCHGS